MRYIYTYFNTKIAAIGALIEQTKDAWRNRIWGAVILMVLWTMFCTIGGILLLPIDFIWGAFLWHKSPDVREAMEEIMDELATD